MLTCNENKLNNTGDINIVRISSNETVAHALKYIENQQIFEGKKICGIINNEQSEKIMNLSNSEEEWASSMNVENTQDYQYCDSEMSYDPQSNHSNIPQNNQAAFQL